MALKRYLLEGRVQGVGCRAGIKGFCEKYSLKGFARNLYSGRVETQVQAEDEEIQAFVEFLASGPGYSRVEKVLEVAPKEGEIYNDFRILADGNDED